MAFVWTECLNPESRGRQLRVTKANIDPLLFPISDITENDVCRVWAVVFSNQARVIKEMCRKVAHLGEFQ